MKSQIFTSAKSTGYLSVMHMIRNICQSSLCRVEQALGMDIAQETTRSEKAPSRADRFSQKVLSLESIFLITNFLLELPSAVFDQLSSVHKPQFAFLSMLMSFTVLVFSIIDLVYKGRQERVSLMKKGFVPWFYHSYPNSKPFGQFPDIIGLVCAFFQLIFASIGYAFVSRNSDNPVRVSTWPIFFAFGLLYSRLSGNLLQRKTPSNLRKLHRAEEFTLAELAAATNDFSASNRVGAGRFGIVYKGRLQDGREVAIKRWDTSQQNKVEEDSGFESELAHLSRLHHKNLVGLVGYCEQVTERLLVYDYMVYDLHYLLFLKDNNVIDSWTMRIGIALDAARGIDYLHNYAVPPVIHRSIKSWCILLDVNWTARISDFDLAMMGLESEQEHKSKTVAERDGYVDPEYINGGNVLTAKSDVYSFGIVLLELLTGMTAIFNSRGKSTKLVDFAVPKILGNELPLILDHRIGSPKSANEGEAIEMVAYTALHCVNLNAVNRPTITSIVNNLERALFLLSNRTIEKSPGGRDE